MTIYPTSSTLTNNDHLDHMLARCAINRMGHRVKSGLYSLGNPDKHSPIFVTANYTLSFDALRSALPELNAYILVLDTHGINVWCAAGKGTFGTAQLTDLIYKTKLDEIVSHRTLILPQLGASGVSGYEVKQQTGFQVEFGPVRATDLAEYLKNHIATPEMRKVRYNLSDRLVLIPVEVVNVFLPAVLATILLYFLGGWLSALAAITTCLAGTVLFPILLPWLPTREFSSKGLILGMLTALPFAILLITRIDHNVGANLLAAIPFLLAMPAVTAYITLNFTGSSTITSRTGVRHEIYTYIPIMAWMIAGSIVITILRLLGLGR
jgi:hypothetical protein